MCRERTEARAHAKKANHQNDLIASFEILLNIADVDFGIEG